MKKSLTIARLMAVIAVCALVFAVLRYAPRAVFYIGPLAGSIWGIYRGGRGLVGGLVGGVLTCWALELGAVAVACYHSGPGTLGSMVTIWKVLFVTTLGAALGIVVSIHVLLLTMLPSDISRASPGAFDSAPSGARPPMRTDPNLSRHDFHALDDVASGCPP